MASGRDSDVECCTGAECPLLDQQLPAPQDGLELHASGDQRYEMYSNELPLCSFQSEHHMPAVVRSVCLECTMDGYYCPLNIYECVGEVKECLMCLIVLQTLHSSRLGNNDRLQTTLVCFSTLHFVWKPATLCTQSHMSWPELLRL